jgi:hypothetical protein
VNWQLESEIHKPLLPFTAFNLQAPRACSQLARALAKDEEKLSRKKREKQFDKILLESIDEAFSSLGESAKSSIYFHLENKFEISKSDIPDRVCDFSKALEQVFGLAAQHIEILIMKCLNNRVKCTYKWVGPKWLVPDLTLTKYVKLLELWCEDTEKIGKVEVLLDAGERQEQQTR